MATPGQGSPHLSDDERLLAELGYKQELERSWGGFTNFAISFSIISILAGCFTNFFAAWNNGGPFMVSIGWPVVSAMILIVALCMAEIVSAYPTAGGIYYWASKLGGPGWGWFTGWFNLVGLVGVVASVDYACASFASYTIGLFDSSYNAFNLNYIFIIFLVILACHVIPEPVPEPHPGLLEQHVGLLARARPGHHRADPDLRAGHASEPRLCIRTLRQ